MFINEKVLHHLNDASDIGDVIYNIIIVIVE